MAVGRGDRRRRGSRGRDRGRRGAPPAQPAPAGGACTVDDLRITASDSSTDKVHGVVTVQLHNKGSRDCRIAGYAGVDLKTADGSTTPVPRNSAPSYPDTIRPGQDAAFNIYYPLADGGGSGVRPQQIVVTPPNDTHQAAVAWPGGSFPLDNPDHPGQGVRLEIGPAGKAG
ncbi:DUF4232 domain-containing protein [Streptomyces sp. CBMA156]|uniref:DUF4232 domain-containing protein n=1 Tax=Streptomyces sp. CBMA156 TaxID=1930280 RepID=UPI001661E421|nr:DUF4232 domain-containing protein [Streptomyces sp. CBMA156]